MGVPVTSMVSVLVVPSVMVSTSAARGVIVRQPSGEVIPNRILDCSRRPSGALDAARLEVFARVAAEAAADQYAGSFGLDE